MFFKPCFTTCFKYFFLFVCLLVSTDLCAQTNSLRFGLYPSYSHDTMIHMFSPLAEKIEQDTGLTVHIIHSENKNHFNKQLMKGEFDLIWTCPACYLEAAEQLKFKAVACGIPNFKGLVFVNKNSWINHILDLKGRKVLAIGKHSLAGYLFLRNRLADLGVFTPDDVTIDFMPYPEAIALNVHKGLYDAGVFSEDNLVRSPVLSSIKKDFKIILESPPIPQFPFAVRSDIDPGILKKIQDSIAGIAVTDHRYENFLKQMNLTEIIRIDDSYYDDFRKFYEETLNYSKLEKAMQ